MLPRIDFRVVSSSVSVHLGQLFEVQVILSRTRRYSVCRYYQAFARLAHQLQLERAHASRNHFVAVQAPVDAPAPPTLSTPPAPPHSRRGRPPVAPEPATRPTRSSLSAHTMASIREDSRSDSKDATAVHAKQRNAVVRFLKRLTKRQKLVRLPAALRFFELDRRGRPRSKTQDDSTSVEEATAAALSASRERAHSAATDLAHLAQQGEFSDDESDGEGLDLDADSCYDCRSEASASVVLRDVPTPLPAAATMEARPMCAPLAAPAPAVAPVPPPAPTPASCPLPVTSSAAAPPRPPPSTDAAEPTPTDAAASTRATPAPACVEAKAKAAVAGTAAGARQLQPLAVHVQGPASAGGNDTAAEESHAATATASPLAARPLLSPDPFNPFNEATQSPHRQNVHNSVSRQGQQDAAGDTWHHVPLTSAVRLPSQLQQQRGVTAPSPSRPLSIAVESPSTDASSSGFVLVSDCDDGETSQLSTRSHASTHSAGSWIILASAM